MEPTENNFNRPLVAPLPVAEVASPFQLRPRDPNDIRWYKPTWGETGRLMGWRWLYFLPAVGLIFVGLFFPTLVFFVVLWKILFWAVALPVGLFVKTAANILRSRKEPFCIHCGYDLTSLPDHHVCPECGEQFSLAMVDEYRRDPNWFIKRYQTRDNHPITHAPFEAGKIRRKRSRDGT